jgi:hypothetical protein
MKPSLKPMTSAETQFWQSAFTAAASNVGFRSPYGGIRENELASIASTVADNAVLELRARVLQETTTPPTRDAASYTSSAVEELASAAVEAPSVSLSATVEALERRNANLEQVIQTVAELLDTAIAPHKRIAEVLRSHGLDRKRVTS